MIIVNGESKVRTRTASGFEYISDSLRHSVHEPLDLWKSFRAQNVRGCWIKVEQKFVTGLIGITQPSSLQSAMERCQSISEGMNRSPFGTAAFACNEQFRQYGLTRQQAKTGLCVHIIDKTYMKENTLSNEET